jgi:hypothetical protein
MGLTGSFNRSQRVLSEIPEYSDRFVLIKKAEVSMHLSVLKQVPGMFPDLCDQLFGLRDAFFSSI